jgi:tRNA threonylcarbamoyladenosine biosynthesis protein TsaB
MLVLALDTTTREGSCALAREGRIVREVASSDPSKQQATRLPGELAALLEQERVRLTEIEIYAVAIGPGSFTGLRIGIATMQALALAAGKPLIGVSGFDALHEAGRRAVKARPAPDLENSMDAGRPFAGRQISRIATWVDAWRGDVFAALYEDGRQVEPPDGDQTVGIAAASRRPRDVFIGDGAATVADIIRGTLGSDALIADPARPLLAGHVARLATDAARAGHLPPPHAISPLYVRRPDVELAKNAVLDRHARR